MLSEEQQAEASLDESGKKFSSSAADRKMINARNKRFDSNRKALENEDFEMRYPANLEPYPHHLREVFKHMQQTISADDLMALQEG